jgi:hypothetical protein
MVVVSSAVQLGLPVAAWTDLVRCAPAQVRGPKRRWAELLPVLGDRVEWDRAPFLSLPLPAA